MENIEKLQKIIDESSNIVFFGGAGVSTESGIPDFRGKDGLYAEKYGDASPEKILSKTCFKSNPELFYKFYRDKILMQSSGIEIKPNKAHIKLAELEKSGKLKAIVTQNIDTLHQEAGSKNVLQIHGTTETYHCNVCGKVYDSDYVLNTEGVPKCTCGSKLKPDIVLYEESLPKSTWITAIHAVEKADCLIVAGTSLIVQPAASILNHFRGKYLVVINLSETYADNKADLVIHEPVGKVLEHIKC